MKRKIAFACFAVAALVTVPAMADDAAATGTGTPAATTTTTTETAPATTPAAAGPAKMSGVEIGLRLGYGIPLGTAYKVGDVESKMSDNTKGRIPIRLDAGYRINPNFYVGAYFAYGIVMINKDKTPGCSQVDCSASSIDFGIMGAYHIMPDASFDPWVGVGFGLENVTSKIASTSSTIKGLTFLDLQVGGDYKVNNNLGIGPFVSFALGQYSSVSSDAGSVTIGDNGSAKAMHEWLTIGIKGSYGIW